MSALEAFAGVVSTALVYSGLVFIAFFLPPLSFFSSTTTSSSPRAPAKVFGEAKQSARRLADGVPFQPRSVSQLGVAALWRGRNKKA